MAEHPQTPVDAGLAVMRALDEASGGAVVFVFASSSWSIRRVVSWLTETLSARRDLRWHHVGLHGPEVWSSLGPETVVLVDGFDLLAPEAAQPALASLNRTREAVRADRCALVVLLPSRLRDAVFRWAPDLYDWRDLVVELNSSGVQEPISLLWQQRWAEKPEAGIATRLQLRDLVRGLGDNRSSVLLAIELANMYRESGELDTAAKMWAEDVIPAHAALHDARLRADAMGELAEVQRDRGEFDEALRVRREQQLPAYAEIGAKRERALTFGKIADLHAARGDWQEAIRVRREEEIPLRAELGDLDGELAALRAIAQLFGGVGRLQEARHTLEVEVLPRMLQMLGLAPESPSSLAVSLDELRSRMQRRDRRVFGLAPESRAKLAGILREWGRLQATSGDLPGARIALEDALMLANREGGDGVGGEFLAGAQRDLAGVLQTQGEYRAARDLLQHALSMLIREHENEENWEVASTMHDLGRVALVLGDLPGAHEKLERALAIKRRLRGLAPGPDKGVASTLSDKELLAAWHQGDRRAGDVLAQRHLGWLESVAARTLNPQDAEEEAIQVFLIALQPGLELGSSLRGFLWGAVRSRALNRQRAVWRREEVHAASALEGSRPDRDFVLWLGAHRAVADYLRGLPILDQELLLGVAEGKTYPELAKEHGVSTAAAGRRVQRLRRGLREHFGEELPW